jgi:hypothetical protein
MDNDTPKTSPACCACGGWRLPALLVLVLASIVLMRVFRDDDTTTTSGAADSQVQAEDAATRERVSLSIDFGNGQRRDFDDIPWREGMTVADLLRSAPDIVTTQRGSGSGAFLTAIDATANEGADGKNWMYAVNGENGDRSFALYELRPGDRVLWTFGPRR